MSFGRFNCCVFRSDEVDYSSHRQSERAERIRRVKEKIKEQRKHVCGLLLPLSALEFQGDELSVCSLSRSKVTRDEALRKRPIQEQQINENREKLREKITKKNPRKKQRRRRRRSLSSTKDKQRAGALQPANVSD